MKSFSHNFNTEQGYIALISAIIIALVLLVMTAAVSQAAFFARFNALDAEYKRISLGLAESCVNVALLRISQSYGTPPSPDTIHVGTDDQGLPEDCDIKSVVYSGAPTDPQRTATIATTGYYHGTFSNMQVTATAHNPLVPATLRASLTVLVHVINNNGGSKQAGDFTITMTGSDVTPSSFGGTETGTYVFMTAGAYTTSGSEDLVNYTQTHSSDCNGTMSQSDVDNQVNKICNITYDDKATTATLTVNVNVTNGYGGTLTPSQVSLTFDGNTITSGTVTSGLSTPSSHTFTVAAPSGYTASAWGEDCASNGAVSLSGGDNKTCAVNIIQNPPPTPGCADTIMMFSRNMNNASDLIDEGSAGKALLDLYTVVTPHPKVGVGSYGGIDGSAAQIPVAGQLTLIYGTRSPSLGLYNLIDTITANRDSNTNIAAAISVSQTEFNSIRHTAGNKKVLIIVSPRGNVGQNDFNTAFTVATTAKAQQIEVFTVDFGNGGGRDAWAQISTSSINNAGTSNNQALIDAENADNDHFFISPDSAAMKNIFETIAKLVCSAIGNPPPPPASTTGKVVVVTHVINDNGGVKQAADFTMTFTQGSPSLNNFSGTDTPGVTVTITPGNYSVDESGNIGSYTKSLGDGCSGTILAGQTITCTIIDDDLPPAPPPPPPPPPPPSDIDVDDWEEVP